jgi:hypothetical protein
MSAEPQKRRMSDFLITYGLLERAFAGIAAVAGVITLACISGLPSATCAAMAQTYSIAATDLGTVSLLALGGVLFLWPAKARYKETTSQGRKGLAITFGVFFVFVGVAAGESVRAARNDLRLATAYCYAGSGTDQSAHARKQIELSDPFSLIWGRATPIEERP